MSTRWITPNFFFVFTQAGLKKLLFRYETKLAYLIKKRTIGLSDTEHGPGARSNARGRERLGRADGAAVGVTFQALVPRNWSTFPRSRKPSRTRLFPVPFLALTRSWRFVLFRAHYSEYLTEELMYYVEIVFGIREHDNPVMAPHSISCSDRKNRETFSLLESYVGEAFTKQNCLGLLAKALK